MVQQQQPSFREWTNDNKFAVLRETDIDIPIRDETTWFLDRYARNRGVPRGEITLLDMGCGRGAFVGKLRKLGWRAFGIEVDARFVQAGVVIERLFNEQSPILTVLREDGRAAFPEGFFDVILSNQVLEHIGDLDTAVAEMRRLLKPGGMMLHYFPAKFRLVEPHYRLPLVHWLPKNAIRYAAIWCLTAAGLGKVGKVPLKASQRARIIYEYSVGETFYRFPSQIQATFAAHGLRADFRAILQERLRRKIERATGLRKTVWKMLAPVLPLVWLFTSFKEALVLGGHEDLPPSSV
jgi:SAM-dependent methyltransferase